MSPAVSAPTAPKTATNGKALARAGTETSTAVAPPQNDLPREPADRTGPARENPTTWLVIFIAVTCIDPSPYQPRLSFDEAEMQELAASVRLHGVQQPVIVRIAKTKLASTAGSSKFTRYELVTGERRIRASKLAGKRFVPAIVRDDLTDLQAAELALLENVQRSNLTVIEEAKGYKKLMIDFRLKEERIAKKVGKSVHTVRDTIRLLALPEEVQKLLSQRRLTAAHGRELLCLAPFPAICVSAAERAARDGLTALSLQGVPLPNATELTGRKLIVELDGRTRFDWASECAKCPRKAYLRSGHSSYCLSPPDWGSKQATAVELQKQEAARVLEEAKASRSGAVDTDILPPGSYRSLAFGQPPSGCTGQCPCRSEATDRSDPTKKAPVCLDPERFDGLREAERQAQEEARRSRMQSRWSEAKDRLLADQAAMGGGGLSRAVAPELAALLVLPAIRGDYLGYGESEAWDTMVRQAAELLEVELPLDLLLDADADTATCLTVLRVVAVDRLLVYAACLWLAQEAMGALSYGNAATPYLDALLGQAACKQGELGMEHSAEGDLAAAVEDEPRPDATYQEPCAAQACLQEESGPQPGDRLGAEEAPKSIDGLYDGWPSDQESDDDEPDDDEGGDLLDEILRGRGERPENESPPIDFPADEPYLARGSGA